MPNKNKTMTRISSTIKPQELCDKMLIAEHREIIRIPNMINSGKAKIKDIPLEFSLGKGHVKFFYNKVAYLYSRYIDIRTECWMRGFKVQDYSESFVGIPKELMNNWEPDYCKVRPILVERINERLSKMSNIKFKGENVELKDIKLC